MCVHDKTELTLLYLGKYRSIWYNKSFQPLNKAVWSSYPAVLQYIPLSFSCNKNTLILDNNWTNV